MEILGIKFAPLNIPLERRLQTFAAAGWFLFMSLGGFCCTLFSIYLVLCTKYCLIIGIYMIWYFWIDGNTCETGGRRIEWIRNWVWWKYVKDYFPLNLKRAPGVELDPKRNYLFCCFPHGIMSTGIFSAFATNVGGFHNHFPQHRVYPLTLSLAFILPFCREIILGLGACSASSKGINWILGLPNGGNVAVLVVGGASEAFNCRPGEYKLVLKNRKGFVKLAIKNGAPLVPVFSFGETDLFNQVSNPRGSLLRRIQEMCKTVFGVAPVIPIGRGIFQYSFGIVPFRKPVTTVVGAPLNVDKMENPSQEDIDAVHEKFILKLIQLFEEQKHLYIEDPHKTSLIIE